MEFDEHEDQDEEIAIQLPPTYDAMGRPTAAVEPSASTPTGRKVGGSGGTTYRYKECLKNHAIGIGGSAVDGCGEFMAAGEEGTLESLKCAACNCHRNFHRKEVEGVETFHQQQQQPHQHHQVNQYYHHHHRTTTTTTTATHPTGYLLTTHPRPLALPANSRDDMEDMSNPSSSGGGGGGGSGGGGGGGSSSSRKRFRTKFSQEQKDKMLELAEQLGWRIQKQDEALVQQFCMETGVKRHVLKVWMHNNKHTLGKKP